MTNNIMIFSLTAPNSHKLKVEPGVGSLSIGLLGMDKKKFDLLVDPTLPINWDTFNQYNTPAGSPWPRSIYYTGNDKGFVEWSINRPIENFIWQPTEDTSIDLSKSQIGHLSIHSGGNKINLILGKGISELSLSGCLECFCVSAKNLPIRLSLTPPKSRAKDSQYSIPHFQDFDKIRSLEINNGVDNQPFDCKSLLFYKHLETLNLWGNMTNTSALNELKSLRRLGIRFAPDLIGFPSLNSWAQLISFIGWNIEEDTGKRLRKELNLLTKQKEMEYSSVTNLKKKIWFETEYAIPFYDWDTKSEKTATKAYKSALKIILKSQSEDEVKNEIIRFTQTINSLPNIETTEREDAAAAVIQLAGYAPFDIDQANVINWFDNVRDF